MKKLLIAILLAGPFAAALGQTLSPAATVTAGGYASTDDFSLSWAMGGAFATTITAGGNQLTQGILQPEIEINTFNPNPGMQSGDAVTIVFMPFSFIDNSVTFTAQLSDATGSFASAVNIGTVTGTATGIINATIPPSTPAGAHYHIRVVSNIPAYNGGPNSNDIAITVLYIWNGAISTNWNTAGNWSANAVPGASDNVKIPATGVTHEPLLSASAAAQDVTIEAGRTLSFDSTGALSITGMLTNFGAFDASKGAVAFTGTAPQDIIGALSVNNLTLNNAQGLSLNSGLVKVFGTYNPIAGTLSSDGNLVLASNAHGTAAVTNAGANTNYVTGNVTVQRYIPAHRAWRMLTAPLSNTGSIYSNWQNNGTADGLTGAEIFRPAGGNGFDAAGVAASIKSYNSATDTWNELANTNATNLGSSGASAANNPFAVFITGPYGAAGTIAHGSQATTLSATGLLQTGTQTFNYNVGTGQYILAGNPYASPIDFTGIGATGAATGGINNTLWVWDAARGGTTLGGYVQFSYDPSANGGLGGYDQDIDVSQTKQTTVIQSGQAFFVQAAANSQTITINESDKADVSHNTNQVFFAPTGNNTARQLRVSLSRSINGQMTGVDGILMKFGDTYKKALTDDGAKLFNYDENLSIRVNTSYLGIERMPLPEDKDSIYLDVYAMKAKASYQFTFNPQNIEAGKLQAWLYDTYQKTFTPVSLTQPTGISFATTEDKASNAEGRFVVVFDKQGALASVVTSVKAWQQGGDVQVQWQTATELGIQQYVVEKAADGQTFSQMGNSIKPRNTNKTETYQLADNSPAVGDNYYRIKLVDNNGVISYSNAVLVKLTNGKAGISLYPNPVLRGRQMQVLLNNLEAGKYTLVLYTADGKQVMQKATQLDGRAAITQTLSLPQALAAGSYRLVVMDEKGNEWKQQVVLE